LTEGLGSRGQTNAHGEWALALIPKVWNHRVAGMSDRIIDDNPSVARAKVRPQGSPLLTRDELVTVLTCLEPRRPGCRGWPIKGPVIGLATTLEILRNVGECFLANHRFVHSRHRPDECGRLCETHELYAYILLTLKGMCPLRSIPVKVLVIPLVAGVCGCRIISPDLFHREVTRDLRKLPAALAAKKTERSLSQRRLISRHPFVASFLRS